MARVREGMSGEERPMVGALVAVALGVVPVGVLLSGGARPAGSSLLLDAAILAISLAICGALTGLVLRWVGPLRRHGYLPRVATWAVAVAVFAWGPILLVSLTSKLIGTADGPEIGLPRLREGLIWIVCLVLLSASLLLGLRERSARPSGWLSDHGRAGSIARALALITAALVLPATLLVKSLGGYPSDTPVTEYRLVKGTLAGMARAAAAAPRNVQLQREYAWALFDSGRSEEATRALERLAALDPDDVDALNGLGYLLVRQERGAEAIPHLRRAVDLEPTYGNPHHNLARALTLTGRRREAEIEFRIAARLKPDAAAVAREFALVLATNGKMDEAIVEARRAVRLDSTHAPNLLALAITLRSRARLEEALAVGEKVVAREPRMVAGWAELGVTYYLLARPVDAARAFAEADRLDSTTFRRWGAGLAMWKAAQEGRTDDISLSGDSVPVPKGTVP